MLPNVHDFDSSLDDIFPLTDGFVDLMRRVKGENGDTRVSEAGKR